MTDTIQTLAAALAANLISDMRADGSPFIRLSDARADWMESAVYAAHGSMGPDDWRYDAIRRMANEIAEVDADADDDDFSEAADAATDSAVDAATDSAVDVYNARLTAWLASNLQRISYCDDAAEEYGFDKERGIVGLMMIGQLAEYREIWDSLVAVLREEVEMREDGETA